MQYITGTAIPRRTFLKGVGASISLPFLDAMVPAGRGWAAAAEGPTRLVARSGRQQRLGQDPELLVAGGNRPRLRPEPEFAQPAGAVP